MPGAAQQAKEAFGSRLREIRLDAGFTARRLAELTGFHFTKISRVEHGGQNLSDTEIRTWCTACGAHDQIHDVIAQARAVESMYREWKRQARGGLRRLQEAIEPLYERTRMFRIHEHWSIPGLLQTAAYSDESMKYWARLLDLPDEQDAATGARMDRQRILRAGDHHFVFLLAEQVLRCRVGSAEIMIEQLDRVLASMTMPNVLLGIIPSTAGLGAHTQTAFWIFDDDLVKVETLTAALDITRPSEISIYAAAFAQMREAAVFGTAARTLVLQARDELLQLSATSSPIAGHPGHGGSGDVRLRPAGASGGHGERERFRSLRGASMSVVTQRARGWYVAVEGPTGAGKTTLAGRLAPLLAAESSMDPFEANPFLSQARGLGPTPGGDMSLATEMTFLALRVIELRRIGALLRSGTDVIADWALAKTRVFPRTTLTPDDADRVEAACSLWGPGLCKPDLIIYLHASPSVLASRITRRGRAFEQAITIEDLARLTALFGHALRDLRVLRVDAAAFDVFDDTAVAALARQLNAIRKDTADDRRHPRPAVREAAADHRTWQNPADRRAAAAADLVSGSRADVAVRY